MAHTDAPPPQKEKKLLEKYCDAINLKHYSPRTGDAYIQWVKGFLYSQNPELKKGILHRRPIDIGAPETLSLACRRINQCVILSRGA